MKRILAIPLCARYRELADQVAREAGSSGPSWLAERRRAAIDLLEARGFPTRRQEDWKYTDLSRLAEHPYNLPEPAVMHTVDPESCHATAPLFDMDDITLILVDGHYDPATSRIRHADGITITPLAHADPAHLDRLRERFERRPPDQQLTFTNLNEALWRDGLHIVLAPDLTLARRIHVISIATDRTADALIAPRLFIELGAHSTAQLTLSACSRHNGSSHPLHIPVSDIDIGENARLQLCAFQNLSPQTHHVATTRVHQQRDSSFHSLDVAIGAAVSRHELSVSIEATGVSTTLDGVYLANGKRLVDNHTSIEHLHPYGTSRQLYKGLIDDAATAVFNGRVRVHPGACGTDGEQTNRNLLLSPDATVDSKPELEIANDDVRCTHGATVGQLDPQELFYLYSRGISPPDARIMLARGFIEEVFLRFPDPGLHDRLSAATAPFFETPLQEPPS